MRRPLMLMLLLILLCAALAIAQEPTQPALSVEEKQALIIASQAVEIAELRLHAARGELTRLVEAAQRPGWVLTQGLEYVPAPPAKEKPPE